MAVQQLAKDQAKREKKKQKELDADLDKAEQDNLQRIEDTMKFYKEIFEDPPRGLPPKERGPGGPLLEAKAGKLIKCGAQMKGTSPLIKKRK